MPDSYGRVTHRAMEQRSKHVGDSYAATNAGIISLQRQLCHELGEWGITVNCVAPGFVRLTANTQWQ